MSTGCRDQFFFFKNVKTLEPGKNRRNFHFPLPQSRATETSRLAWNFCQFWGRWPKRKDQRNIYQDWINRWGLHGYRQGSRFSSGIHGHMQRLEEMTDDSSWNTGLFLEDFWRLYWQTLKSILIRMFHIARKVRKWEDASLQFKLIQSRLPSSRSMVFVWTDRKWNKHYSTETGRWCL
jgi:hypothetical protein